MPRQNSTALLQAAFVLPLFLYLAYSDIGQKFDQYLRSPRAALAASSGLVWNSLLGLLKQAGLVFLLVGSVDLWRQRQALMRNLRMSKQEIRDEAKEGEANPEVKAKIRRLRRDLLRGKMMRDVPTATAVIVNPTHYAVAIKYDINGVAPPLVVAKGKNYLALRIRQKAIEHEIPIVENPPLAQVLYKSVEVGQEIPAHLYRAVAEVLAYIYRLMGGRLPS